MKIGILTSTIAAAVCAFAVSNARAQTNFVTLTLTTYQQGTTNFVNSAHGTNIVYAPPTVTTYSTVKFIQQVLGPDIGANPPFTSAAKLGQTSVDDITKWLVVDGTNVVDITGIVSVTPSSTQI